MNPRWKVRPEGSTWGDWGPDDQLGRLNLIDANKVRQGVAEVREGKTFCLSLPLDLPGGKRTFLEDGDEVTLTAWAPGPDGTRTGLGEVRGRIVSAA